MRNQYDGQNGNGYQPTMPPKPPPTRSVRCDLRPQSPYVWQNLCRCKSCNAVKEWAPFGSRHENLFAHLRFCVDCGESQGWYDDVCRWESFAVWWKPSTWGAGVWIAK